MIEYLAKISTYTKRFDHLSISTYCWCKHHVITQVMSLLCYESRLCDVTETHQML